MNFAQSSGARAAVAGFLLAVAVAVGSVRADAPLVEPTSAEAKHQGPTKGAASAIDRFPAESEHAASPGAALGAVATAADQPRSTSSTPPAVGSFSKVAVPLRNYPRVASAGRCAPLYRNGTRGACIAEKPCRGYGIRNDENQVLCMCYLTSGGCDAKSRCDGHVHACVADTKVQEESE